MPVTIGTGPQADFDQPLQLLQDCHRRIEHFLEVLLRVVAVARHDILNVECRDALETALRYFREAAPRHTRDEEESLFPRLRKERGVELQAALASIVALESDHVRAAALHEQVDTRGKQWLQAGRLSAPERLELQTWLEDLRHLYRGHIEIEDHHIFPLAAQVLGTDALASLGKEMRTRRARPSSGNAALCARHATPETSVLPIPKPSAQQHSVG